MNNVISNSCFPRASFIWTDSRPPFPSKETGGRGSNRQFKFFLGTSLNATGKVQPGPHSRRLPIDIHVLSRLCALLNGCYFDR